MARDELQTLLESREWVTKRVDRVEFIDLMTVRRTINLTVNAGKLRERLPEGSEGTHEHEVYVPLGWFLPWANAGAVLLNADGRVIPYMTSAESDLRVMGLVESRLKQLAIAEPLIALAKKIPLHRKDPAARGQECEPCNLSRGGAGYLELMADRWGCRAVRRLLQALYERRAGTPSELRHREARELAMIVLAWQTNFVLLTPLSTLAAQGGWANLQLCFDEELREWRAPVERGKSAEGNGVRLTRAERKLLRGRVSRGGPFSDELNGLFPRGLWGALARSRCQRLAMLARRGPLRLTWHVAWHQASGLDTSAHQVDVTLPAELMAVRVRMLRKRDSDVVANVADQVGSRATIVAPDAECVKAARLVPPPPPPPTLFSLSIAQRSTASWRSGAWIAGLTGLAVLMTALFWLPMLREAPTQAVTMLIVAPPLVAALLSVRAGSELAEQLTATLRPLIGTVGLLAAICAIGVLANQAQQPQVLTDAGLKWLWVGCAVPMLLIAVILRYGAHKIGKFIEVGRRLAPRRVSRHDIKHGRSLNPDKAPRISPPDLWLDANEGAIVPWGWLDGKPHERPSGLPPSPDDDFWQDGPREELVSWVQEIFCYTPSKKS
jgi:hypothetical protein